MKKTKEKKKFDSVEFFRKIKEQTAKERWGKFFKEQKGILRKIRSGEIKLNPQ